MDRIADGVEERRAAAREVFALRQRRHIPDRRTVVDDLDLVVEEHGGNEDVRAFFPLAAQHAVEAADGVRFQSRHRAAAVEDEHEFRLALHCILFFCHDQHLLFLCELPLGNHCSKKKRERGRTAGDICPSASSHSGRRSARAGSPVPIHTVRRSPHRGRRRLSRRRISRQDRAFPPARMRSPRSPEGLSHRRD